MSYYEFKLPAKILSGEGALEHVPHELQTLGASRPLLLSDQGLAPGRHRQDRPGRPAARAASSPAETYCHIPPDSSIEVVNHIAQLYRDTQCDSLIAVGGGSVIDTAKGVGMVLAQAGHDLLDSAGCEVLPRGKHVPFVAVPTHRRDGQRSDFSRRRRQPRHSGQDGVLELPPDPRCGRPRPPHDRDAPAPHHRRHGLRALVHAIEAATCLQRNPVSDSFAEKAIQQISQNLTRAVEHGKDRKARHGPWPTAVSWPEPLFPTPWSAWSMPSATPWAVSATWLTARP